MQRLLVRCAGALVAALASVALTTSPAAANPPGVYTIVDTLGSATPATQFSIFGSSGFTVNPWEPTGPRFTLSQPTVITEIGGFFNNCGGFDPPYVPNCPVTSPFIVRVVRASSSGVPDLSPSAVVGTFNLSHDNNPVVVSYESVAPNLLLDAGTYFALFSSQSGESGLGLSTALDPFAYLAGITPLGWVNLTQGSSSVLSGNAAALRILGQIPTGSELLSRLLTDVTDLGPGKSLAHKVKVAQAALAKNDLPGTCSILSAFINEVKAQSGKKIPPDTATALITDARQIKTVLGC